MTAAASDDWTWAPLAVIGSAAPSTRPREHRRGHGRGTAAVTREGAYWVMCRDAGALEVLEPPQGATLSTQRAEAVRVRAVAI